MQEIQAYVTGDGPLGYTIRFNASRLELVREKYARKNAILKFGPAVTLQEAPESLIKTILPARELGLGLPAKTGKRAGWNAKSNNGGRKEGRQSPVINLSTGKYYDSITEAAAASGTLNMSVSQCCRNKIKATKGIRFRYATSQETNLRRLIE